MICRFSTPEKAQEWLHAQFFVKIPKTYYWIKRIKEKYCVAAQFPKGNVTVDTPEGDLPPGDLVVIFNSDCADHRSAVASWKKAIKMDEERYLQESARTVAAKFFTEKVPPKEMEAMFQALEAAMTWANDLKAALFYDRPYRTRSTSLGSSFTYRPELADLLHAVLGLVTEAGEMAENVYKVMTGETEFDRVNMIEELGDLNWYGALLCRFIGIVPSQANAANIAKLRKRYPDKFTEAKANVRDLAGERQLLESTIGGIEAVPSPQFPEGIVRPTQEGMEIAAKPREHYTFVWEGVDLPETNILTPPDPVVTRLVSLSLPPGAIGARVYGANRTLIGTVDSSGTYTPIQEGTEAV